MRAILALEDGRVFDGEPFGASGTRVGEICFNTSMTGYQEVLTDPSYRGQIVAMTYPHIGNYGTNTLDQESAMPHVRGFVIEELSETPSSWRSELSLDDYLKRWDVPGIQGIDTRALTRHLRDRGAMKACITTELETQQAIDEAIRGEGVVGMDYVKEVTATAPYRWDPENRESTIWSVAQGHGDEVRSQALPPVRHQIVAYDYGLKENILRRLRQAGFGIRVVPANTRAVDVLSLKPDGVFLSNGPGDPSALDYAHEAVQGLMGKAPIFGICLGHQVLG
nr:glutamine-hydrolyzing carbamoyl-phosphate synthase small subunit [Chthoniobacterales bacterium]